MTPKWFTRRDPITLKRISLQDKLKQENMFSHMSVRPFHTGWILTIHLLQIRTKSYLSIFLCDKRSKRKLVISSLEK